MGSEATRRDASGRTNGEEKKSPTLILLPSLSWPAICLCLGVIRVGIVASSTGKSVIGRPRESSGPQSRPASELVLRTDFTCAQARNSLKGSFQAIFMLQAAYLRYLYKIRVAEDTSRGSDDTRSPAKSSAARS